MLVKQTICPSEVIVQEYMDDILSGKIPACTYVKLAIKRHLSDLETAEARGFYFDTEAAQEVITFFAMIRHSKGKWAGKPFILEPWQQFIIWVVFGWKHIDGTRRFTTAYQEIARKNGKSTQLAGIGLYGLGFDNESGAEIYSVATKEEQAKITFGEGQNMARKSGRLGGLATIHQKAISIDSTSSTWKPLGRDSKTQDGLNPHMVLVDEFHAHPDRSMLDVMDSAVGARTQPLLFIITTAGFNVQSTCYMERDYATKILKGIVEDDSYFAIIFTLDRDETTGELLDDWKNPKVWVKANPNLGISVELKDMERMCKKAIESPASQNNFLTKKLNVWTTQETKFFNMEKWDELKTLVPEEELLGRECYIGVDLASKADIGAIVCIFPFDDGRVVVLPRFYCPQEGAEERSKKDRVPYLLWAKQGHLILTPGNRTDFDFIRKDIVNIWSKFNVQKMGFDQWNFEYLYQRLVADGMDAEKVIEYGQTIKNMSEPTKELDALVVSGKLVHNGHPVLRWMASNTAVFTDSNENVKPVKDKSSEKIDGIVATVIALGLSLVEPATKTSVYETRGVLEFDE
jgi:phage terminase large subunit-like protein